MGLRTLHLHLTPVRFGQEVCKWTQAAAFYTTMDALWVESGSACDRSLGEFPASEPAKPFLGHHQELPDECRGPVQSLVALRCIGSDPQGGEGRLQQVGGPEGGQWASGWSRRPPCGPSPALGSPLPSDTPALGTTL